MPILKNKTVLTSLIFFLMIIVLPLILIATRQQQDIRPRALTGNADLRLTTPSANIPAGGEFSVMATVNLTNQSLRISGADFIILYERDKLDVVNVVPQITSVNPQAAFTDAPIVTRDGYFDGTYNFLRVAEVARKPDNQLAGTSTSLALITFRAKTTATGRATIKYPDDNQYLELVGINIP